MNERTARRKVQRSTFRKKVEMKEKKWRKKGGKNTEIGIKRSESERRLEKHKVQWSNKKRLVTRKEENRVKKIFYFKIIRKIMIIEINSYFKTVYSIHSIVLKKFRFHFILYH